MIATLVQAVKTVVSPKGVAVGAGAVAMGVLYRDGAASARAARAMHAQLLREESKVTELTTEVANLRRIVAVAVEEEQAAATAQEEDVTLPMVTLNCILSGMTFALVAQAVRNGFGG
jgi:hypothetical protein